MVLTLFRLCRAGPASPRGRRPTGPLNIPDDKLRAQRKRRGRERECRASGVSGRSCAATCECRAFASSRNTVASVADRIAGAVGSRLKEILAAAEEWSGRRAARPFSPAGFAGPAAASPRAGPNGA
jgi:hypothetical protein